MSQPPEVDPGVGALHTRGAAAWPGLAVTVARLAAELERRLGQPLTAAVVGLLHHDVYLAVACTDGDAAAVAACDRHCQREVDFAASRLGATAAQADDIRSELRRLLFVTDAERRAAIDTFAGRGDLRGYARVIAARALARRMQRDQREQPLEDDMLDALSPQIDPEIELLREHYRPEVDAALRAAIVALEARERAVLRYHLLDGWNVDRIGERYGVHRATAARWLVAARASVAVHLRTDLAARLAISTSQVDSIVALVTSRVDVSIERLLASP